MLKLKKFFLAFAMVAALGWATSASAQVGFQVSSDSQDANADSLAAAVGQILLSATSNGTVVNDSTISVDFGVDIVADDDDPDEVPDPIAPVTLVASGLAACTEGDVTVDIDDSVLTIEFAASCDFLVGDTIVFSGIRVNANDAGVGSTIEGDVSATVPAGFAASNPITFLGDTSPQVAEVMAPFEIEIEQGGNVLTCVASDILEEDDEAVIINFAELFNQGFASSDDETGLADYDGEEVGQTFTITFKDVPPEVTIRLQTIDNDEDDLVLGGDPAGTEVTNDEDDPQDLEFEVTIDATNSSGSNEEFSLIFEVETDDAIDLVNGSSDIPVGVSYEQGQFDDQEAPEIVENEVEDTGFVVTDCLTWLELTWAVANVAGYDTGLAIANTSEDDLAFGTAGNQGAEAQNGTCTLTGYPFAGGTPVQFTTPTIDAGETGTVILSSTSGFNGFAGYILTVCNFLNAHAFAFITNNFGSASAPDGFQGAEFNVVPIGSRVIPTGESLGK
jgi:hypothetical protein